MGAWAHGRMGAWAHGRMGAWAHGRMGAWAHGRMGAWAHGRMGAWALEVRRVCRRRTLSLVAGVWATPALAGRLISRYGGD
jgi:hypothetical protein